MVRDRISNAFTILIASRSMNSMNASRLVRIKYSSTHRWAIRGAGGRRGERWKKEDNITKTLSCPVGRSCWGYGGGVRQDRWERRGPGQHIMAWHFVRLSNKDNIICCYVFSLYFIMLYKNKVFIYTLKILQKN